MHGTTEPLQTNHWWELDISAALALIEAQHAEGAPTQELLDALTARILIHDIDALTPHLVGPFGGNDRMIGMPIDAFWPAESRGALTEMIIALVKDPPAHMPRSRPMNSLMIRDGIITISLKSEAIVRADVVGVIYDDRSRWALRASEERYKKLIHHLPFALLQIDATAVGVVLERLRAEGVTDLDSHLRAHPDLVDHARQIVRVTDANSNAELLFGSSDQADFIGPVDYLFTAAPDAARRVMVAHFNGSRSYAEILKVHTFDGRLLDVQFTVTYPTPPERLDITLISLEDVTDRLRTDAQLRQLQADFSRAGRIATLGELATSIAHEVNQPLSAIVTNAETSLRWLSREDPNLAKVEQLTSRIAESAHRANDIVQRIRSMAARHTPEHTVLDINAIAEETLLFVRHDVESRSIELDARLGQAFPRLVGDRVQLQQVLVNLLLNGIQAIVQAARSQGRIELSTGADGDRGVSIVVRDNGPGIAPENLDLVFDGFFTTKEDGIGIGLAICQSIIAAHGGRISVSNHPNGGAQFEIWLPAEQG